MNSFYNKCTFYNEFNNLLDPDSLNVEHGTRYLVDKYINSDMKILELGSRYGTVSCVLDYLVKDSKIN